MKSPFDIRDFGSVDDAGRLEKLEGLLRFVDFVSYLSLWESVLVLTLSYQGAIRTINISLIKFLIG